MNRKQAKTLTKKGLTIVEVTIALALLSATVISTTTLVRSLLRTNVSAGKQTQAGALGTQQMELLRAYRDERIIDRNPAEEANSWERDIMDPGGGCRHIIMETDDDGSPEMVPRPFGNPVAFSTDQDSYLSLYRRIMRLCPGRQFNKDTMNYEPTHKLITAEVFVYWDDSQGIENRNIYRTYLSDWNREPDSQEP